MSSPSAQSRKPPRRRAISEPAQAARLQRIYARLQEGCTSSEIAVREGLTPQRVRQLLRAARASSRPEDQPNHTRMQVARLAPALKALVSGATSGQTEVFPALLRTLAQLDRYAATNWKLSSPSPDILGEGNDEHSAVVAHTQAASRELRALDAMEGRRPRSRRPDRSAFNGAPFEVGLGPSGLGEDEDDGLGDEA